MPRPPGSTLFPYTTLFRSLREAARGRAELRHVLAPLASDQPVADCLSEVARRARSPLADLVVSALLIDRKSTRLNSRHLGISYAVVCLNKKIMQKLTTHAY